MKFKVACVLCAVLVANSVHAQENSTDGSSTKIETGTEIVVELTKSRRITGELDNVTEVVLETKFGEAKIPLKEVEGVKLHIDEKDSAVVAFKNGDVVTGQLKMDLLAVTTDWGNANVKLASVETILMTKNGSFYQDSSDGKNRWRFGDTRELANTTRRQQTQTPQRQSTFQQQRPGTLPPQRQNVQQNRFGG